MQTHFFVWLFRIEVSAATELASCSMRASRAASAAEGAVGGVDLRSGRLSVVRLLLGDRLRLLYASVCRDELLLRSRVFEYGGREPR